MPGEDTESNPSEHHGRIAQWPLGVNLVAAAGGGKELRVSDYLPDVYLSVRRQFPEVARALDDLARVTEGAGPLPARERRLVKLGISIGALAEGAVRSNVRKALDVGVTADEIRHTALLAITTRGFPGAVAALKWIDEVLAGSSEA
jgi:alkylhydroperoxidase/carboxymuconolactone decarboxylase family protein YurZ